MTYYAPTTEEVARRRAQLAPFDGWNERAFCQIVAWMGAPESYLDLGSGTGAMVNMARKVGVEAYGVDRINGPEHWFIDHDLRESLVLRHDRIGDWTRHDPHHADPQLVFSLITCLEVAEHLPLDAHQTLVETIARHLKPVPAINEQGGILIFSAAPPGQAGEHHVGCRAAPAWRSMFHEYGIHYQDGLTRQLAHLFAWVTGPASHWLPANLQVFSR